MRFAAAALLLGVALAAFAPQLPDPAGRLRAETDAARAGLTADAPEDQRASPLARLDRTRNALDAGRTYLAAYLLETPWEGARNFAFVKASETIKSQEAFRAKWKTLGEPRPRLAPGRRLPAAVIALAAAADARGPATYHASLPYAEDSGLFGGLYYLADAHSAVAYASMLREIGWPEPAVPPAFRSLAAEIDAFDTEMTTTYEGMRRENHPTYISASAALKQARTLNGRGEFAGALFEYLLSRYLFAPLRGPAAAPATPDRIAAARAALPPAVDHSVAAFFLELADEALAGSTDAQRRAAAAVLEDVLPAYHAAIAAPSTTTAPSAAAAVTITLVRWPFT